MTLIKKQYLENSLCVPLNSNFRGEFNSEQEAILNRLEAEPFFDFDREAFKTRAYYQAQRKPHAVLLGAVNYLVAIGQRKGSTIKDYLRELREKFKIPLDKYAFIKTGKGSLFLPYPVPRTRWTQEFNVAKKDLNEFGSINCYLFGKTGSAFVAPGCHDRDGMVKTFKLPPEIIKELSVKDFEREKTSLTESPFVEVIEDGKIKVYAKDYYQRDQARHARLKEMLKDIPKDKRKTQLLKDSDPQSKAWDRWFRKFQSSMDADKLLEKTKEKDNWIF